MSFHKYEVGGRCLFCCIAYHIVETQAVCLLIIRMISLTKQISFIVRKLFLRKIEKKCEIYKKQLHFLCKYI